MTVHFTWQTIITLSAVIAAVIAIGAYVAKAVRWVDRQTRQDREILKIKEENTLICFALAACLDGLQQLGANHSVPIARDKLEKHLNKQAHE